MRRLVLSYTLTASSLDVSICSSNVGCRYGSFGGSNPFQRWIIICTLVWTNISPKWNTLMSLEFRHPPFSPFIAFLALPQYCLSSPTTTVPCDLLRSHCVTSACLWLCLHRLETLIGYTPTHRTTIPVLAHIKLHHSIGKPCDRPLMS